MKRCKIIFEALEGYDFDVSQEASGELRIKLIPTNITVDYSGNYTDPPIPEGWEHVEGEWNNGFVIQDSKGNQFAWVPVGLLNPNGTLDGTNFSEKFGRRNYLNDEFSDGKFREYLEEEEELCEQWKSVKKYGGFYISRYNISRSKTGEAKSIKGAMPWTCINWSEAMEAAETFGDGVFTKSHLPYGAEYDSVLEWFIESEARTTEEIASDSSKWGNFWNTKDSPKEVVKTGRRKKWSTNGIYDFAGNVIEFTQERNNSFCRVMRGDIFVDASNRVIRGASAVTDIKHYPVAHRDCISHIAGNWDDIGFRAALYIK